jgi:hypothetical protein
VNAVSRDAGSGSGISLPFSAAVLLKKDGNGKKD